MQSLDTEPCVDKTPDAPSDWWHSPWDSGVTGWGCWTEDWREWLCLDWVEEELGSCYVYPRLTWEWHTGPSSGCRSLPGSGLCLPLSSPRAPVVTSSGERQLWQHCESEDVAQCYYCCEIIYFSMIHNTLILKALLESSIFISHPCVVYYLYMCIFYMKESKYLVSFHWTELVCSWYVLFHCSELL